MIIKILLESDIPIYRQIRNVVIEGIALGQLTAGEGLPSVRQLSSELGINMHTVNKAYTLLKQDGFITIHRQKGVVVNQRSEMKLIQSQYDQLSQELKPLIAEAFCRGLTLEEITGIFKKIYTQFKEH